MKNLFNSSDLQEILDRINSLEENSKGQWGRMNVSQMLFHCKVAMEVATGEKFPPRLLIGKIIGRFIKFKFHDSSLFAKNTPTDPSYIAPPTCDFDKEKARLKELIIQFSKGGASKCTTHPHSLFGKLTPEQWSIGMYKHMDHHLRQFGV